MAKEQKNLARIKKTGIIGKIVKVFKFSNSKYQYKVRIAPRVYRYYQKRELEVLS